MPRSTRPRNSCTRRTKPLGSNPFSRRSLQYHDSLISKNCHYPTSQLSLRDAVLMVAFLLHGSLHFEVVHSSKLWCFTSQSWTVCLFFFLVPQPFDKQTSQPKVTRRATIVRSFVFMATLFGIAYLVSLNAHFQRQSDILRPHSFGCLHTYRLFAYVNYREAN